MFLQGKRQGASFLIMVVIMALVMSMFAVSVSQLSRSRSSTLISDATEKQVLYLAEDAANQMIYQLNVNRSTTSIGSPTLLIATELGANDRYRFEASYSTVKPFYSSSSGTVIGIAYLMDPSNLSDKGKAIYSKTVYLEVQETGSGLAGVKGTWRESY
jgi:uncharacterized protein (UPF0333 family)